MGAMNEDDSLRFSYLYNSINDLKSEIKQLNERVSELESINESNDSYKQVQNERNS